MSEELAVPYMLRQELDNIAAFLHRVDAYLLEIEYRLIYLERNSACEACNCHSDVSDGQHDFLR